MQLEPQPSPAVEQIGSRYRFVGGPWHNCIVPTNGTRCVIVPAITAAGNVFDPYSPDVKFSVARYTLIECRSAFGTSFFEYHCADPDPTFRNWEAWDRYDILRANQARWFGRRG